MMAAGMDASAIVAAVAEMEASMAPAAAESRPVSAGALRQRRYRERHQPSQSVTDDAVVTIVTDVTLGDAPPPSLSPSFPQTPNQPHTHTPENNTRARKGSGFSAPEGVPDETWRQFIAQRKKRLTEIAYSRICNTLTRLADAGWPPGEMVERTIERGWETIYEPKERPGGERNHHNGRQASQHPGGRTGAAADRVFGGMGRTEPD
jgi:hypothetical protein